MAGNGSQEKTLTAAQHKAIAAMLENRDIKSAANAAGVSERTLHRWLEDDVFVQELRRAENALIDRVTRRMLQAQEAALAVMVSVMIDKTASDSARLRAAGMVQDGFIRMRELRNLEERLTAMERALAGMGVKV